MAIRWAADLNPASITAADLSARRLEHATRGGATSILVGDIADNLDAINAVGNGHGPSIVIDTTGNPDAFRYAQNVAATFGHIILLGDTGYPDRQHLTSDTMSKGLTIQATHDSQDRDGWTQRKIDARFFELVANDRFPLDQMVTHEFTPDECEQAYAVAENDRGSAMGILFDWTRH